MTRMSPARAVSQIVAGSRSADGLVNASCPRRDGGLLHHHHNFRRTDRKSHGVGVAVGCYEIVSRSATGSVSGPGIENVWGICGRGPSRPSPADVPGLRLLGEAGPPVDQGGQSGSRGVRTDADHGLSGSSDVAASGVGDEAEASVEGVQPVQVPPKVSLGLSVIGTLRWSAAVVRCSMTRVPSPLSR